MQPGVRSGRDAVPAGGAHFCDGRFRGLGAATLPRDTMRRCLRRSIAAGKGSEVEERARGRQSEPGSSRGSRSPRGGAHHLDCPADVARSAGSRLQAGSREKLGKCHDRSPAAPIAAAVRIGSSCARPRSRQQGWRRGGGHSSAGFECLLPPGPGAQGSRTGVVQGHRWGAHRAAAVPSERAPRLFEC